MNDRELEGRLRAWYRSEVGTDETAPQSLRRDVVAIPRSPSRLARWFGRNRGITLLAAAAVLLVGGAAAGAGLLRLPSLVPPEPVPSLAIVPTPSPAAETSSPMISPSPAPSAMPTAVASRAASWTVTGSMVQPGGPDVLLPDGKVLAPGGYSTTSYECFCGAQLYDPASGSWTATGDMIDASRLQTSTLLLDGKVLVTSSGSEGQPGLTELYDPDTGSWTTTGNMAGPRQDFTATRLPNGKVLVAGGFAERANGSMRLLASAELYDPGTRSWSATGSMGGVRATHTATLLRDGKVLITGGSDDDSGRGGGTLASAELYDPATGSWTATGSMGVKRQGQTATLLPDGKVLVAGGAAAGWGDTPLATPLATAELYDPGTGLWTATAPMAVARKWFTATVLLDGRVLVAGGWNYVGSGNWGPPPTAELYDPGTGTWATTASVVQPRAGGAAILLLDGRVLVAGGDGGDTVGALWTAELYDPGSGIR